MVKAKSGSPARQKEGNGEPREGVPGSNKGQRQWATLAHKRREEAFQLGLSSALPVVEQKWQRIIVA